MRRDKGIRVKKHVLTLTALAAALGNVWAQPNAPRPFRATIGGPRGDVGRCVVEVNVDGVATVEVFGEEGRLNTLAGQPAEWRRMICNGPLPSNPAEFRFKAAGGRGKQLLERDPRENRGVAVVRIEDPKAGRDNYVFELEWRGGFEEPSREREQFRERRYETYTLACDAELGRRVCPADTRFGAVLVRQRGEGECRLGVSWGYDERGIWVDRGCRGDFQLARPQ